MTIKIEKTWMIDLSIMTVLLGLLYLILLGHRPLFVPDEGRYAEIAREMAENNDFITPFLNHIKYFEKPPFFYWIGAFFIKHFGANISAIRLVNGILSIIGCLATYTTGRLLYGRLTGLFSATLLATSGLYFVMGHTVSLDLPLTVFMSIALYAILLAFNQDKPDLKERYLCLSAFSAAIAVLTKGLIGLILPSIIVIFFIMIMRNASLLRMFFSWRAICIFLIVALPWHIAVSIKNPEFLYFYIIEQHFLRYSKLGIGHYQPVWFFIPWLILGFFPWIVFLPKAAISHFKECKRDPSNRLTVLFLMSWVLIVFLFFSFSKSKLIPYILPLFPALALLTGRYLAFATQRKLSHFIRWPLIILSIFSTVIAIIFYAYLRKTVLPDTLYASICLGTGLLLWGVSLIISWNYQKERALIALVSLFIGSSLFWLSIITSTPAIDTRTILPLASYLERHLTAEDEVISYDRYYQDLPFYLKKRITVVNWQNELGFGMRHQTQDWMLSKYKFIEKINRNKGKRFYILLNKEDWEDLKKEPSLKNAYIIKETINDILVIKH